MTAMTVTKARKEFAELINRVAYKGERVVIRRRGRPVVVVVPVEDPDAVRRREDRLDLAAVRKARKERGSIP